MNNFAITEPLILSMGSHKPDSGRGCAMEVISWTLGQEFTDQPLGVDYYLARMVQNLNDGLARASVPGGRNYDKNTEVPARDALRIMDLAFRTLGTSKAEQRALQHRPGNFDSEENNRTWNLVMQDFRLRYPAIDSLAYSGIDLVGYVTVLVYDYACNLGQRMMAFDLVEYIIDRFRFHAGLDVPTIPDPGAIDNALRRIQSQKASV